MLLERLGGPLTDVSTCINRSVSADDTHGDLVILEAFRESSHDSRFMLLAYDVWRRRKHPESGRSLPCFARLAQV